MTVEWVMHLWAWFLVLGVHKLGDLSFLNSQIPTELTHERETSQGSTWGGGQGRGRCRSCVLRQREESGQLGQGRTPEGLGFRSNPDEREGHCKMGVCVCVCVKERENLCLAKINKGLPYSSSGKESVCDAGDQGSRLGSGRSSGEGNGNPLQYSCLENSTDREAWRATVYGVAKSRTWLGDWTTAKKTNICVCPWVWP